ncbi:MAG: hypothetical protein HQL56_02980 [Magnetococcales bacterium]|nr:hypothetical protein [Magnetococcales bacterium]
MTTINTATPVMANHSVGTHKTLVLRSQMELMEWVTGSRRNAAEEASPRLPARLAENNQAGRAPRFYQMPMFEDELLAATLRKSGT